MGEFKSGDKVKVVSGAFPWLIVDEVYTVEEVTVDGHIVLKEEPLKNDWFPNRFVKVRQQKYKTRKIFR